MRSRSALSSWIWRSPAAWSGVLPGKASRSTSLTGFHQRTATAGADSGAMQHRVNVPVGTPREAREGSPTKLRPTSRPKAALASAIAEDHSNFPQRPSWLGPFRVPTIRGLIELRPSSACYVEIENAFPVVLHADNQSADLRPRSES